MRLLFIIGPAAVGKMTVGQELCKITDFRLMHNHHTIEPVLDIFGYFDTKTIFEMRDVVFKNFASTGDYGLIYTFMYNFDSPAAKEHINHVINIFKENCYEEVEVYCVELYANSQVRFERNCTENRLKNKKSKKDIEESSRIFLEEEGGRFSSEIDERFCDNYLVLNNEDLSPMEQAQIIKKEFDF